MSVKSAEAAQSKGLLGTIEKVGNKVPHPVLMFLYLIILVIVLSWVLNLAGVSVTEQIAVPVKDAAEYNYYHSHGSV
jgi:aminobenzoyl-glutamate transport protein